LTVEPECEHPSTIIKKGTAKSFVEDEASPEGPTSAEIHVGTKEGIMTNQITVHVVTEVNTSSFMRKPKVAI
jgi:hypothetical protein